MSEPETPAPQEHDAPAPQEHDAPASQEADTPATADAPTSTDTPATTDVPAPDERVVPAVAAPRPAPPRPGSPIKPSPAALAGKKPAVTLVPAAPPAQEYDPAAITEAKAFGAVTDEGTITVQDGTQVREIGSVDPAAGDDPDAALEPFARAYLDLAAFLDLTDQALNAPSHTQAELNRILENLRKNMKEPKVVGDIPALRQRAHDLREKAKEKIHALDVERQASRDQATAERTAFVESIEQLVATDPQQISWRQAGETMRGMVAQWKEMQKAGPTLDKAAENALWKRLSVARGEFDRKRRTFFAQLDEQHEQAARIKEDLIARAESQQDSTDWGPTVRFYRDLMDEWKAAPRGTRAKDDAQWARFKAAQDVFFAARNADLAASDAEQKENLRAKEALLKEASAIDPSQGLDAAKAKLRSIQDRWEDAGKVPRRDIRRMEDGLRAVERSVKQAEQDEWRRTDPRTRARVEGASSQLHAAIASYEEDLAKARATGDPAKIEKAQAALDARKEWLAVIERSARDLS